MSISLQKKFGGKTPWVLGKQIRMPRIQFPNFTEGRWSLPTPGKNLLVITIYVVLFWLAAGGIYIYIRDPVALGADSNGNPLWLYPTTHEAFVIESIVAAVLIFLAGFGFIFLYQSTKHAFNYSYAIKLLIIGAVLAFGSFIMLQYMLGVKDGTIQPK